MTSEPRYDDTRTVAKGEVDVIVCIKGVIPLNVPMHEDLGLVIFLSNVVVLHPSLTLLPVAHDISDVKVVDATVTVTGI